MTHYMVDVDAVGQNPMVDAKGRRDFKVYWKGLQVKVKVLKEG